MFAVAEPSSPWPSLICAFRLHLAAVDLFVGALRPRFQPSSTESAVDYFGALGKMDEPDSLVCSVLQNGDIELEGGRMPPTFSVRLPKQSEPPAANQPRQPQNSRKLAPKFRKKVKG